MSWTGVMIVAAVALGLSNRVLGGSTRMTLAMIVAVCLLGLAATQLR